MRTYGLNKNRCAIISTAEKSKKLYSLKFSEFALNKNHVKVKDFKSYKEIDFDFLSSFDFVEPLLSLDIPNCLHRYLIEHALEILICKSANNSLKYILLNKNTKEVVLSSNEESFDSELSNLINKDSQPAMDDGNEI